LEQFETRVLLSNILVTSTGDSVSGPTFRAALLNATAGDHIVFQIPKSDPNYNSANGSWTIALNSTLPVVSTPNLVIDGLTQQSEPGASTTHPVVQITPATGLLLDYGLFLVSSGNTVEGLVLDGFQGAGLEIQGPDANNNLVIGNYIGTDVTGQTAVANGDGIVLFSSSSNTIGGTASGQGNIIAGSNGIGVDLGELVGTPLTSDHNVIQGNYIGVGADGTTPLGNHDGGVQIISGSYNQVGGTNTGQNNIIANNNGGVGVYFGIGNALLSNSIYDNVNYGVRLFYGGNNSQSAPILTDAMYYPGASQVDGSLAVKAGASYLVQFFGNNPASDEGQTLLGGLDVAAQPVDGSVNLEFTFAAPATLHVGSSITAIATVTSTIPSSSTNPAVGDSSAFSLPVLLFTGTVNPFIVTNTADSGIGSLRFAIQAADADTANSDTITFQIPITDPNYDPATESWTIPVPTTPLAVSKPSHSVFINGLSQQSEEGATTAHPVIQLTPGLTYGGDGLTLSSGGNTVSGLVIDGFKGNGLVIAGSSANGNVISGDFIGTDVTGTLADGNGAAGISISSSNNTIGGTSQGAGNLISGNQNHGIEITGSGSTGNVIAGNTVGLNASGSATLGNGLDGVFLDGASYTIVGPSNVLSGNGTDGQQGAGLEIEGASQGNTIFQNRIGTNAAGNQALGNSAHGVFLGNGAINNTIGPGNVISGNGSAATQGVGVYLFGLSTTGNQVVGNQIGTNANGSAVISPSVTNESVIGVLIYQSLGNTVQGNVVSGNRYVGVEIAGVTTSGVTAPGNQVLGNLIGTDASGTHPIANGLDGIFLNNAPNNTIGGTTPGARNVISANLSVGIQLFGPETQGNVIQGNFLGLNSAGQPNPALLNGSPGNFVGIFVNSAPRTNQIGGTAPGQANQGQVRIRYSASGSQQSQAKLRTSRPTMVKSRVRLPKRPS